MFHTPLTTRRAFLTQLVPVLAALSGAAAQGTRRLILRSSWQTVNIGDIGHTPGVLHLLEEHLPEVAVTLWPSNVGNGVKEMIQKRFPKVAIIQTPDEIKAAFTTADFLLHGSGPSLVGEPQVAQWQRETGKPFGVYGITLGGMKPELRTLLNAAKFVLFRDSVSLQFAKDQGVQGPIMEFCPDGAFAVDLRNDEAAAAFLKEHDLQPGKFLCCLSRLRKTPYWEIHRKPMTDEDKRSQARNEAMKEHDHAPLRAAIQAVVEQTDLKILLCPEDESQMAVGKSLLYDPLPDAIKKRVVWRSKYWLTDEALSTYRLSAGLFGSEMHSPIMALGQGIPAIVCRFKEQTSKGIMWKDLGLGEWLFDFDQESEIPGLVPAVLALAKDPVAAKAKAAQALALVKLRQRATMQLLRQALG